ncbi:protealysin inhibitor emfourin [Curtobacterium sp. MCBD17_021]|uniref:protealysin inhibitor emfourin n=1 Tax=Curtobacterium sp. MCBD17_021 TaxID=2175665 RepID=UPI000DA816F5|nr:protealysin inhibitor emfourin [Curtobacterium sp. MCBD17_021]PZE66437.1 hypothetical protein DEI83_07455 [Curtobacterium sp. MCBD17_021]
MQIVVHRSGGFAGTTRSWRVDTDSRPDQDRWDALVGALPRDVAGPADDDGVRDDFVWTVSVARTTVTIPGRRLDGPWATLVERVRDQGEPG